MFRTNARTLAATLTRLLPVVEPRACVPILGMALLRVETGRLVASATNLDQKLEVNALVEADGPSAEVTVDPRALLRILRLLPRMDRVELSSEAVAGNGGVVLSWNGGRARFNSLSPGDVPAFEFGDAADGRAFLEAATMDALARVTPFISKEETRYYLNGVLIDLAEAGVFVATDGHRLAAMPGGETLTTLAKALDGRRPIVPHDAVSRWLEIGRNQEVDVAFAGPKMRVTSDGAVLTTKLIDGKYPDWKRVVPRSEQSSVVPIDRPALLRGAAMVNATARASGSHGVIVIQDGRVQLQAKSIDIGEIAVDVGETTAANREIGLNLRYLGVAVAATRGKTVELVLDDGPDARSTPIQVRGSEAAPGEVALIMPLRDPGSRASFVAPARVEEAA
jgi:DNA polymerase-3 subunit beta